MTTVSVGVAEAVRAASKQFDATNDAAAAELAEIATRQDSFMSAKSAGDQPRGPTRDPRSNQVHLHRL